MRHTGNTGGIGGHRDDADSRGRGTLKPCQPLGEGGLPSTSHHQGLLSKDRLPTWNRCLEAFGRSGKGQQHHTTAPATASGTNTDTTHNSSTKGRSSTRTLPPLPRRRAGVGSTDCRTNNRYPSNSSHARGIIEMDQVRVRPNLYIGSKPSEWTTAGGKDDIGGFGLGLHGIHLPSPTNPDQKGEGGLHDPMESSSPLSEPGGDLLTGPPLPPPPIHTGGLLCKKSPAVGNMYSRFIEDPHHQDSHHYQPWKGRKGGRTHATGNMEGEAYVPMDTGGGRSPQEQPNAKIGSKKSEVKGSLRGLLLDVIKEDLSLVHQTGVKPHTGVTMPTDDNNEQKEGMDSKPPSSLLSGFDEEGYLQPRPPNLHVHQPQQYNSSMGPVPHSPSDLRLLELIRRARLGSATDSGVFFFGDDFSMSDVSDGQQVPSPGSRGRHGPGTLHGQRGVADIDGLHLVVDGNMNGLVPRMPGDHVTDRMRRPDSLAVRGHEYEELPSSRYQARYPYADMEDNSSRSGSGGGRPLPLPMVNELKSGHVHNDSSDSLCRPLSGTSSNGGVQSDSRFSNTYRKRENPLYDEGEADDLQEKPSKPGGLLACPCSGLILIGIVAAIAFLLAILIIVGTLNPKKEVSLAPETAALVEQLNQNDLLNALTNMKRLEMQYNSLLQKYNSVEAALNLTQSNNGSVSTKVDNNAKAIELLLSTSGLSLPSAQTLFEKLDQLNSSIRQELNSLRENTSITDARITRIEMDFTRRINSLGSNLTNQVNTVSKVPGPKGDQGPPGAPGAGNLSKCMYYSKRQGSAKATDTLTDWWPSDPSDIEAWVVMGMECTTEGGETALMETQSHPTFTDTEQFRCVCRGSIGTSTSRFCRLNMWRCPKTT